MSGVRPQSAALTQETISSTSLGVNLPPPVQTSNGRVTSPRPATAGLATARSSISSLSPRQTQSGHTTPDNGPHRDAVSYFDSFKKEELRELIAQSTASWLLSPDFRGQAGFPCGLISNLSLSQEPHMTLLFPKEAETPVQYRELHQIIRELTSGIFGMNQMPSLCLEPNFDLSTTCQLPLAYKNTKVGQILLAVDYSMKSLWHGVHVVKSKRPKLAERWRTLLDVNTATGEFNTTTKNAMSAFTTAGQEFTSTKPPWKEVYDDLNHVDPNEYAAQKENKFFNSYADFVRCILSMNVSSVRCCSSENLIAFDSSYDVTSAITLPDDDFIPPVALQRLRRRLRHQMKMIRKGLVLDPDTRRNIALLKFISATSLIMVALRRRLMRVPDMDGLLTQLPGDILRTDVELPPFALGKLGDQPCETFTVDRTGERKIITHTHGEIQFDVDTSDIEALTNQNWCRDVQVAAQKHLTQILGEMPRPEYKIPTTFLNGKEHYVVRVPLTTYYPASPPIPAWLHARYQLLSGLRPRKLPMNDLQLAEKFKQTFGFRKALANKSIDAGLKLSACRGLVAPFIALMRKAASSSLLSPDLQGMTLLHHACIHNRSSILSLLLSQNPNLSTRRAEINPRSTIQKDSNQKSKDMFPEEKTGPTALLFSARCGALECVTALLASRANPMLSDSRGRSAIHHAAESDQTPIVRALLRRHPNLLEIHATGDDNATPLLTAASSGALLALEYLIRKGANIAACDVCGDGVVHRAALNFHTDILEYFVLVTTQEPKVVNADSVKVWDVLVEMLRSSSVVRQDASLRCLEVLLHHTSAYWRPLQEAGAVVPLVNLLQSSKRRPKSATPLQDAGFRNITDVDLSPPIRSLACSVVCLMSEQDCVRREVADAGAIPTLIGLLKPAHVTSQDKQLPQEQIDESLDERFELQSRSSVVLSDLAHVSNNATRIADHGGIGPLVDLLQIDVVDVLVNAVTTLAALCRGDTSGAGDIQLRIMECGAAGFLVDFLRVRDDSLQTATADAIAAVCDGNTKNQDEFVKIGVLPPLVSILRGHCISAQMTAALAVDCLTKDNSHAQREAVMERAPDSLCRLFQIWSDNVKERGACALWALAGCHPEQQRAIAHRIGTKQIIEMLISKSDTLQLIGCQAVAAISRNRISGQARLAADGTVPPLVRLIRLERTSRKVVMATIGAINSMCMGVAHLNNKRSQKEIADEGAIELLMDRVWKTSRDESMQIDLFHCLACVVTGCLENEEKLNELGSFGFEFMLELLNSVDVSVKFRASSALALFAFNRIPQQHKIMKVGGVHCTMFDKLLECKDEKIQAGAAFQLVILARVVSHTSVVDASARGIIMLVHLLDSIDDDVIIVVASYLASLAHTRAGVPEAIVTSGAVCKLLYYLRSENDQVRRSAAQALGYLSFNRTASRELMAACRAEDGVYESFIDNLDEDGRISDEFIAEFKRQSTIGLPIPKAPNSKRGTSRPHTAGARRSKLKAMNDTGESHRARSSSPSLRVLVTETLNGVSK